MRLTPVIQVLALLSSAYCQTSSSKRGLVYIQNPQYPHDDSIWSSSSSDLTWYYNYGSTPSPAFDNSTKLQFVPMLWGANTQNPNDTTFLNDVQGQIQGGAKISYVLTFNEPDGQGNGGSNVPADMAAQVWINNVEPLRQQGVKLGAPAVTGSPSGFTWLQNFFSACNNSCTVDFIPVHWYGNFEGLASHIGQVRGTYPNMTIWVTEYADNNVPLAESQSFYNSSSQYFDRIEYVLLPLIKHCADANFSSATSLTTPTSDPSVATSLTSDLTQPCLLRRENLQTLEAGTWEEPPPVTYRVLPAK